MNFHQLYKEFLEEERQGNSTIDERITQTVAQISEKSGRNTIVYATRWSLPKDDMSPEHTSLVEEDIFFIVDMVKNLSGQDLDLIIHSPGGTLETAEFIVKYLRSKFSHIRVIVPQGAMSAATVLACSSDLILMTPHSYLGPIDPQILLSTPLGLRFCPAQAILKQFEKAKKDHSENPLESSVWYPMLDQYGPDLLELCRNSIELSKEITSNFLEKHMLKNQENPQERSKEITEKLIDYSLHKTHSRHITLEEAQDLGLIIKNLEEDRELYELVMKSFVTIMIAFNISRTAKIYANNIGNKILKKAPKRGQA